MPRPDFIYRKGQTPNTNLTNTQKVQVFSFDTDDGGSGAMQQIGMVQSWNPTETRAIEPHRGIGFGDRIAELGVGVTDHTATLSIMMLYVKDIMQTLGYASGVSGAIRSLKHHRWPFDVREDIVLPFFVNDSVTSGVVDPLSSKGDLGAQVVMTMYEGCWLSDYSKAFNIGDTAVTQDATMSITDVNEGGDSLNEGEAFVAAATANALRSNIFSANQ